MRIDVFTLFPQAVDDFCSASLLGRARSSGLVELRTHDPREHTTDVHRTRRRQPVRRWGRDADAARAALRQRRGRRSATTAVPARARAAAASTRRWPRELAAGDGFSLLCGRYEGVDHRVREHLVDGELSVGDVVLAGGEVAACLVIEAVTRLLPGVMGNDEGPETESFGRLGLLEEPQYTRPAEFRGWAVPDVLRSGDHGRVARWRLAQALHRTLAARPDLIAARGGVTDDERRLLEEFPPVPYP